MADSWTSAGIGIARSRRSYVLRCLLVRTSRPDDPAWLLDLQEAWPPERRRVFSRVEDLAEFLRSELESPDRPPTSGKPP